MATVLDPPVTCAVMFKTARVGSTWLGSQLDAHECCDTFVPRAHRDDLSAVVQPRGLAHKAHEFMRLFAGDGAANATAAFRSTSKSCAVGQQRPACFSRLRGFMVPSDTLAGNATNFAVSLSEILLPQLAEQHICNATRVFVLTRRNTLEMLLSLGRVNQVIKQPNLCDESREYRDLMHSSKPSPPITKYFTAYHQEWCRKPVASRPRISLGRANDAHGLLQHLQWLQRAESTNVEAAKMLAAAWGAPAPLVVSYESLREAGGIPPQLANFLRLPPPVCPSSPSPSRNLNLNESVSNFDAVAKILRCTPYEWMLGSTAPRNCSA